MISKTERNSPYFNEQSLINNSNDFDFKNYIKLAAKNQI